MEPAANRAQVDAFQASLQAFLENVLVPDCLLQDCTIKLDSVMRHRSSCTRWTKSTVDIFWTLFNSQLIMVSRKAAFPEINTGHK